MKVVRPTAGPRPSSTPPRQDVFAGEAVPGVRPILHVKLFNRHRPLRPLAHRGRRHRHRHPQHLALEQGAARQLRAPPARSSTPARRQLRPSRPAPQGRAGAGLPGRRPRRPPAAAGRRPRLEVDVVSRTWTSSRPSSPPRDRSPRRAAHAARHPRRQHLLQLPRGQPHLLAPDRPAAAAPPGALAHRRRAYVASEDKAVAAGSPTADAYARLPLDPPTAPTSTPSRPSARARGPLGRASSRHLPHRRRSAPPSATALRTR